VVVYSNTPEPFSRTLYSLSPAFQRDVDAAQYEVIVLDNGSSEPPDISEAVSLGLNVEVLRINDANVSPARAINTGLNASIGRHVGVMIDGARLASAGLLKTVLLALRLADRCVVGSRGRYLDFHGFKRHREGMLEGRLEGTLAGTLEGCGPFDQTELLDSVQWKSHPDRLFDISVFDESSGRSWSDPIAESGGIFMSRQLWRELDGYCSQFQAPDGGYVNLDTWRRACLLPDVLAVVLLGEATFLQWHEGRVTDGAQQALDRRHDEYQRIRGEAYRLPDVELRFFGALSKRLSGMPANSSQSFAHVEGALSALSALSALELQLFELERSTSWRLTEPIRKIKQFLTPSPVAPPFWHALSLEQRQQFLQARVEAIYQSRSWRLLEPLRRAVQRLRR
jgi:hypothetical protein